MSRMFAISDLHGYKSLYDQINLFLESDDIVYFLGDATDRGPDGWELMKAIWEHPNWIYLKGNHEDMLYNAYRTYKDFGYLDYEHMLLIQNGGNDTWESAMADPEVDKWMNIINKLPVYTNVFNKGGDRIHLCHSGYLPANFGKMESAHTKYDMLWNRHHYILKWFDEIYGDDVVIHGHTPIPYIIEERENVYNPEWEYGAYWYSDWHKCCIDNDDIRYYKT